MVLKSAISRKCSTQFISFSSVRSQMGGSMDCMKYYNMKGLSQFKELSVRQFKGSMDIRHGIREISLGNQLLFAVLTTNQNFLVVDLQFQDISLIIRRSAYPRFAKLSPCQRFIIASFSDSTVFLYDTKTGNPISKILGIPRGVNSFSISGNSNRIFYANNNTICLWNVPKGHLEMSSQQWRNINSFAIDSEGQTIALGTYSGKIIVLTVMSTTKVAEMSLDRHKSCVMHVCFAHSKKIFSVSYDKIFITTSITISNGQKIVSVSELQLQTVPKRIESVCGMPHLFQNQGIFWLVESNKMRGYCEGLYGVAESEGMAFIMRYNSGKIEWFRR